MLNRMHRASQSIIDRLSKSSKRRHVKRREDWLHRLSMEYLEERVVLSNISWINPQGGDWDVASNWSAGRVPNAQDAVTIATANLSITHSSGANDSVQSLTSASPITLSGGSLQLAAASSINGALNVSGGSLVAKGSLNVQSVALSSGSLTSGATMTVGQFAWSGGSVSGTGQINATGFKTATSNLSLSNAAMTLSSTGLALAGDASLPLVGNAHLSGSIANATTYSLTAQVPTTTIGGFAFTGDTVTLANGTLSLSGTATLPVVGSATLAGTVTDATHYSLSAQVPSLSLGGYTLANDTVALANGALTVKGTASLPIIGSVALSGTFKDPWNYSLSAQVPTIKVGNYTLTNDTVTLTKGILSVSGSATLPVIGTVPLSGTIKDAWNYSFSGQLATLNLAGYSITNNTVTFAKGVLSLSGTATLPVIGSAALSGTITNATTYSLSTQVASLKLGGYALTNDTVTLAGGALSIKGTAALPIIGSATLSGTFKDQWNYSLSAQLPSLTVAGFTFTNSTATYAKGILSLSGSATLPIIGSTPLSGTINDIWNYTLSGQVPSLKIRGATFTNDTITLSKGVLSVSGTATVPVVGPTTLAGTITDASRYSLSAQVASLKIGGYSLTGDTVTFANGSFSVKGTAALPIIGSATLSGTFKDQWNYSLSAQLPSVKVGGFTLTNDTVTYAKGVLSVSGSATLPIVGSVPLSGTINDAWTYSFAAQVPSISLGGFALTNDTLSLSKGVVTLSGTATLPLVGSATFTGSITDATHYSLSAPVASLTLGAYALTNDTITLANGALSIKGTAALPVIGSVPLSGTYKDQWNYSLSAQLPTLTVAGFSSTNDTVTYAKGVLSLSGAVTLPLVGSVALSGTIKDAWNYTLTAPLPTLTVAGYSFSNNTVTLSKGVVTLSGTATLPVVGTLPLSGTITDATHFSLSATPGDLKLGAFTISGPTVTLKEAGAVAALSLAGKAKLAAFGSASLVGTVDSSGTFTLTAPLPSASLLGGLVTFSSMSAIMTASAAGVSVGIGGTGTVANIGTVNFKGTVSDEANYSLTGQAKLSIAGFTIDTANFTLGTQALGVAFTLPIPDIGDVGFTGSYGPGGQWSIGATYPGPVQVGPVTLTDLGFVLASDSLTLQATGTIADLQALANVKVTAQIFYDGRFMMTADAHVVQVGPFSLGEAIVTVGDDYPDKHFEIDVHAVAGFPNLGAGMTLDGVIISSTNYHFTGTDTLNIAGLSITSVQATLDSTTGFTFKGSWNYGIITANVDGTIDGSGHAHFEGNATAGTLLGGFQVSTLGVVVDADPTAQTYSIDASTTLDVAIAQLNLTAHSSLGTSGWDPLFFTATANIGGPLSSILSGTASFTVEPSEVDFSGSLSAANGLGNFNVDGKVFADGTFQIGGFLGSVGQILAEDAAKILNQLGASADQIAKELSSLYNSTLDEAAHILSEIGADVHQIADALQNLYHPNLDDLAKALWNNATNDVSELIDALKDKVNGAEVVQVYDQLGQLIRVSWDAAGGYATQVFDQLGNLISLNQFGPDGIKSLTAWLSNGQWISDRLDSLGNVLEQSTYFGGFGSQLQSWNKWTADGVVTAFQQFNAAGGMITNAYLSGTQFISYQLDGLGNVLQQWISFGGYGSQLQEWDQFTAQGVVTAFQQFNAAGGMITNAYLSGTQFIKNQLDGLGHVLQKWTYFGGYGSQLQEWDQWTAQSVMTAFQQFNSAGTLVYNAYLSGTTFVTDQLDSLGNVIQKWTDFGGYGTKLQEWDQWTSQHVLTAFRQFDSAGNKIHDAWLSSGRWISQSLDVLGHVLDQWYYYGGYGTQLYEHATWNAGGGVLRVTRWTKGNLLLLDAYLTTAGGWIENYYTNGIKTAMREWDAAGNYLGDALQNLSDAAADLDPTTKSWWPF